MEKELTTGIFSILSVLGRKQQTASIDEQGDLELEILAVLLAAEASPSLLKKYKTQPELIEDFRDRAFDMPMSEKARLEEVFFRQCQPYIEKSQKDLEKLKQKEAMSKVAKK